MGKIAGFIIMCSGFGIIFYIIIMAIGGLELMVRIILPIAMRFAPVDEKLQAWVEIPLSMGLVAYLRRVETFSEDGYLVCGKIDFEVTLAGGGADSADEPTVAVIYVQEDAEIDEISRYVLRAGPLNYPSIFFWLVSLGSLGVLVVTAVLRLISFKKSIPAANKPASAPSVEAIQVIALEDTSFKE